MSLLAPLRPARRVLAGARHGTLRAARPLVRRVAETDAGLYLINALHRRLPLAQKRRFFFLFFEEGYRVHGRWRVEFCGRRLLLPLHPDFPLAWAAAIGFDGYDVEIHAFYERLLRSPRPPRVVFDVGASYGQHSLKFLAHGVRTISFEPNPACHGYFQECCALNGLRPEIEAVAVSDGTRIARLAVPRGRTYLGTIAPVPDGWSGEDVETFEVPTTSLDEFAARRDVHPDLIKIDVEGAELDVLAGARRLLAEARPLIVLESWRGSAARPDLHALLTACGYRVRALEFPAGRSRPLSAGEFCDSTATNFAAEPRA